MYLHIHKTEFEDDETVTRWTIGRLSLCDDVKQETINNVVYQISIPVHKASRNKEPNLASRHGANHRALIWR